MLENPDRISKAVLARRLDSQTAFEIVSIDIADIDVGDNIGARLQADQAEADTRVARAKAEGRRAMAVAQEQEMIAQIEESRAKVVEAEAEVPKAIAEAFRQRQAGHHGLLQAAKRAGRHRDAQVDRRRAGISKSTPRLARNATNSRCRRLPMQRSVAGRRRLVVVLVRWSFVVIYVLNQLSAASSQARAAQARRSSRGGRGEPAAPAARGPAQPASGRRQQPGAAQRRDRSSSCAARGNDRVAKQKPSRRCRRRASAPVRRRAQLARAISTPSTQAASNDHVGDGQLDQLAASSSTWPTTSHRAEQPMRREHVQQAFDHRVGTLGGDRLAGHVDRRPEPSDAATDDRPSTAGQRQIEQAVAAAKSSPPSIAGIKAADGLRQAVRAQRDPGSPARSLVESRPVGCRARPLRPASAFTVPLLQKAILDDSIPAKSFPARRASAGSAPA